MVEDPPDIAPPPQYIGDLWTAQGEMASIVPLGMIWLDPDSSVSVRASLYVRATRGESRRVSLQIAVRIGMFCKRSDVKG